tara:strand:- start:727 stop:831 length:105 start_codon:yes stop_codon:yes gene_type:complete
MEITGWHALILSGLILSNSEQLTEGRGVRDEKSL